MIRVAAGNALPSPDEPATSKLRTTEPRAVADSDMDIDMYSMMYSTFFFLHCAATVTAGVALCNAELPVVETTRSAPAQATEHQEKPQEEKDTHRTFQ